MERTRPKLGPNPGYSSSFYYGSESRHVYRVELLRSIGGLIAASWLMRLRVEALTAQGETLHLFIFQKSDGIGTASAGNRYMTAAVPTWRGHIPPVFDVAEKILLEEVSN
jgi:hypothetical protein